MSLNLDKSSWKRVSFGDVARHVTDRVDPETSGLNYFLAGEHIPSGRLAITDRGVIGRDPIGPMFYKRFQPGHVLYVSRRTYLRKVAVPEFEGITGEKTFVLESVDPSVLSQEFLPFLLSSEDFHGYAIQNSRGSVNPYLNWGELIKYEFDLPPIDEQKRISDLLWVLNRHRVAIENRARSASRLLHGFLRDHFSGVDGQKATISDLCTTVVGGVWGAPEGEGEVDVLALGPRVYAPGIPEFVTEGSPMRSISRKQARTRIVEEGDIILERSGGSPEQPVGRVVIAGVGLPPCVPTDFQRLLRPSRDAVEPRYLFWRLHFDWMEGNTRDFSKRTTNITNLSIKDYISRKIAIPPRAIQAKLLENVKSFEDALSEDAAELAALAGLHSSLLADVFSGG
ncbi:restriction endonuclease subunit S [Nocardia rhamnosiphila]